jgi:hypothetical protein
MTPQQLIRKIRLLPENAQQTEALEKALEWKASWCANQKEHWLGWLRVYEGPGAYDRKGFHHDAAFAYNHCGCPPMVLWLGEAVGIELQIVKRAKTAALQAGGTYSSRCAAIRRHIAWADVEQRLLFV